MEHVERSHPLGVSLGEVVVDGDHVHSLAREGVEEHRQGGDEGLSFTGRHLGNLSLMQGDAADELYVIVDHVPGDHVASGFPGIGVDGLVALDAHEIVVYAEVAVELGGVDCDGLVFLEPARGALHYCERFGEDFVEGLFDGLVFVLHQLVGLVREFLLFGNGDVLVEFDLDLGDAGLEGFLHVAEFLPEGGAAGTQVVVRESVDVRICCKDLVEDGLDCLVVAVSLGSEYLCDNLC